MNGTLYGVGVGPGDPELMTLKAIRIIKQCPLIAVPTNDKTTCSAYKIASGAVDIADKPCIEIPMPMTKNAAEAEQSHTNGTNMIAEYLKQGKDIAFLTLGDPTIYATYIYLHKKIEAMGYKTQIISGIPSFCAAAARLNIPLAEQSQELHIVPATYQPEEALNLSGTKIFLKIGSKMKWLKERLNNTNNHIYTVENCGMPNERISTSAEKLDEKSGYYTLVIVKSKE